MSLLQRVVGAILAHAASRPNVSFRLVDTPFISRSQRLNLTRQNLSQVISQNSRQPRSKLLQAGLQYDIAHAKALDWSQLRTKQVQRERERLRKAKSAKKVGDSSKSASNSEDTSTNDDEDSENEVWDAICAIGLKVFSYDPDLELEVVQSPELMETPHESKEKSSTHAS